MKRFSTLKYEIEDGIAKITFNREKDTNPFSRNMTLELTKICQSIQGDGKLVQPTIRAVILTGGTGRSFSVGGDFNDVSALETEVEITVYLNEIIDLYISLLQVEVPIVAAIDNFAIGQGLQVALMSDWRFGTDRCQLQMPELKNGTACPLGSAILESLLGRALMMELILDCSFISATSARAMRLLNQLVSVDALQNEAMTFAKRLADFPRIPYTTTKRIQNQRLVAIFENGRQGAIDAHVATIRAKAGHTHYNKILGRI